MAALTTPTALQASARPVGGLPSAVTAANDNGTRRVFVRLTPPSTITIAEIEVFGAVLMEMEALAANDS